MEAAVVGSALIGGLAQRDAARRAGNIQADAARQAAQTQLQATREANQLNWAMYQQALANQAPYMRGGQTAFAALMGGMGLGGTYGPQAAPNVGIPRPNARPLEAGGPSMTPEEAAAAGMVSPMPYTGGGAAPGTVPGTGTFDPSALPAGLQPRNLGATPEEMAAASQQYGGRFTEQFRPSDITLDPSYQFRVEQGLRALKASRAATGMLQTGQGLQDIVNYGQQAGAQEYQAAYQRFMEQQAAQYNRLAALAGVGQTATGAATAAGTAAGQQIGSNIMGGAGAASNYLTGAAAAQAGGVVGGANALTGAMGGGLQNWMALQYLNRPGIGYTPGGGGAPAGGTGYGPPPGLRLGGGGP